MPNIFSRLISRFGSKPTLPSVPATRGGQSAEPIYSVGGVQAFLAGEAEFPVQSSNVASARYDPTSKTLRITYLNGAVWDYGSISEQEAQSFAQAASVGTWLWNNVKIRGTKAGHKKPARQIN